MPATTTTDFTFLWRRNPRTAQEKNIANELGHTSGFWREPFDLELAGQRQKSTSVLEAQIVVGISLRLFKAQIFCFKLFLFLCHFSRVFLLLCFPILICFFGWLLKVKILLSFISQFISSLMLPTQPQLLYHRKFFLIFLSVQVSLFTKSWFNFLIKGGGVTEKTHLVCF